VELNDFQTAITTTYGERDRESGVVSAVAWLASLAAQLGVDLGDAASRFADGCPRCSSTPCACP